MGEQAETMTVSSSRVRRHWAVAIASTISVAALMILSGVAAAGISFGSSDSMDRNANATSLFPSAETVAPLGPPDASEVPLLAAGPLQSLNLQGETGAALGGSVSSVQSVSLDQSDLVVVTLQLQHVDQLNTYLQAVSNPSSPAYAHFLTIS